jgi:MFS family permease
LADLPVYIYSPYILKGSSGGPTAGTPPQGLSCRMASPASMGDLFRRVLGLQLTNMFAETFAWQFIYLHAHDAGHTEVAITTFFILMFGMAVVFAPLISRKTPTGRFMALGLVARLGGLAIVLSVAWYGTLLAGAVLWGLFIILFWVPYNVVFLRMTTDSDRAGRSTILFGMFAVTSAIFPLLGGRLFEDVGFWFVAVVAIAVLAVGAMIALRTPWGEPMRFDLRRSFRQGGHLAPIVAGEGLWQGVFWVAVPIGTLRLFDQGSQYGAFLAFLGLMAGVASVVAGRWSDRTQDRKWPLVVSTLGVAVFTLAAAFAHGDVTMWSLMVGMTYFFLYMMMAFTFTIITELADGRADGLADGLDDTMGMREVMLNVGRVGGGTVFLSSLLLDLDLVWPLAIASTAVVLMLVGYLRRMGSPHGPR